MCSYGQRSMCADLLNSYIFSIKLYLENDRLQVFFHKLKDLEEFLSLFF